MFDISGPKKVIDYSNNKNEDIYEEFEDLDSEMREAFKSESFKIVQKEKFIIIIIIIRRKELAEALE